MLRDAEAHCGSCGKETVQRFYEATSLHALTLPRLRALLDQGAPAMQDVCSQCGAEIGPAQVVRWVLHFGYPSGDGLLQGFADADGGRRWLLSPHRAIDVQLVPAWDTDADASMREVDALDDETLRATFGRVLNPKEGARRWLARASSAVSAAADAAPHQLHRLAPGTWVAYGVGAADHADEAAIVAALCQTEPDDGPWVGVTLVDDGVLADAWPHAPSSWLAGLGAATGGHWVRAYAGAGRVAPTLRTIVAGYPVQLPIERLDDEVLRVRLPELGDWPDHPTIDAREVAFEAARSLLAVDDAARIELERLLQALTGIGAEDA